MIVTPQDRRTAFIELPPRGRTIFFHNDHNYERYYINFPQLSFQIEHWQSTEPPEVNYSGLKALKTQDSYPFFPNMSLKDKSFCLGSNYYAENVDELCNKVMEEFWSTSFYWAPALSYELNLKDLFVDAAQAHKLLNFDVKDGLIHIYDGNYPVRSYRIPRL